MAIQFKLIARRRFHVLLNCGNSVPKVRPGSGPCGSTGILGLRLDQLLPRSANEISLLARFHSITFLLFSVIALVKSRSEHELGLPASRRPCFGVPMAPMASNCR